MDAILGAERESGNYRHIVNERLKDVLNMPREKLEIDDNRDHEKDQEDRDIDRGPTHGI